ncbi:MAG: hypothetical protein CMJ58_14745 [Planctomycetaceae bacterium]|nr:hypothetical protein [Planctomycetaceae bacterium]
MSTASPAAAAVRISLRELLVLAAAAAVGCAAMQSADEMWLAVVGSGMLLAFMAMAVLAVVERGARQAFAIGFVLCATIYRVLLVGSGQEMDPYAGRLPTSRLLRTAYEAVRDEWYVDAATGRRFRRRDNPAAADAASKQDALQQQLSGWTPLGALKATAYYAGEKPVRAEFMALGHALITCLAGYLGGRFAVFVYAGRVRREALASTTATPL